MWPVTRLCASWHDLKGKLFFSSLILTYSEWACIYLPQLNKKLSSLTWLFTCKTHTYSWWGFTCVQYKQYKSTANSKHQYIHYTFFLCTILPWQNQTHIHMHTCTFLFTMHNPVWVLHPRNLGMICKVQLRSLIEDWFEIAGSKPAVFQTEKYKEQN